jgi:hypothetical protein
MRALIDMLLHEVEVPPPGMVRVGFDDGDVRYMTPLAATCFENEKERRGKKKQYKSKPGPERKKKCKNGHPMTGPKSDVRVYNYGGTDHRCCYHCIRVRAGKMRVKKEPKTLAEWAAKARKAAA